MRAFLLLPGLLLSILASSCATSQLHYINEGAVAALKEEKTVLVIGLTGGGSSRQPDAGERTRILNDLETRLGKKRKNLRVAGHGAFERKAGPVRAAGSGSTNQLGFVLSSTQRQRARELGAEFGLVVVLRANETWCGVHESSSTEEIHEYDKEGNVIACRRKTTYTTTSTSNRKARADYLLYDLATGAKIWECSSEHTESSSRSSCSDHCYPPPPPHPAPPCLHDVMKNMAAAAVRKFPK